jgi:hypothetical protein
MENGEWRMENGESGEWRVESGEWRVETGKLRMAAGGVTLVTPPAVFVAEIVRSGQAAAAVGSMGFAFAG